ncbi:MAG: hypothetical protein JXA95_06180 [Spirochaetales bacterium]|nr:hypothetical protein [Spirochaetales bacterium]
MAQRIITAGNIIAATGYAITLVAYMKAGAIGGGVIGVSVMAAYVADSE